MNIKEEAANTSEQEMRPPEDQRLGEIRTIPAGRDAVPAAGLGGSESGERGVLADEELKPMLEGLEDAHAARRWEHLSEPAAVEGLRQACPVAVVGPPCDVGQLVPTVYNTA